MELCTCRPNSTLPYKHTYISSTLPLSRPSLSRSTDNPGRVYHFKTSLKATPSEETLTGPYAVDEPVARFGYKPAENTPYAGCKTAEKEENAEVTPTDEQTQAFEFLDNLDVKVSWLVDFYIIFFYVYNLDKLAEWNILWTFVISLCNWLGVNYHVAVMIANLLIVFYVKLVKTSAYVEPERLPEQHANAKCNVFEVYFLCVQLDSGDTPSLLLLGGGSVIAFWIATVLVGAIDSIPLFPKMMEVVGLSYTLWFSTRYLLFKKNREELVVKIEEIKQQVLGSKGDEGDE